MAVNYHNLTNQTAYKKDGKVDTNQTKSMRDKAQDLINWVFGQKSKTDTLQEKIQWQNEMRKKLTEFDKNKMNKK